MSEPVEHWADDPYFEFHPDLEGSGLVGFFLGFFLVLAFALVWHGLNLYVKPPNVNFPPPVVGVPIALAPGTYTSDVLGGVIFNNCTVGHPLVTLPSGPTATRG